MKKVLKTISKVMLSILFISATFLTVGCGKEKNAAKTSTPATIINDVKTDEQSPATPISDEGAEENIPEESLKLNGLYKKVKPVQVFDIYYEDLNEVLKFYKVKDVNSLHHELRKENFTAAYNSPTSIIDWLYFFNDDGFKKTLLNQNGDYFILDDQFTPYENIYKIELNEELNNIKMYLKYKESPLYVVITLEKIANSENLLNETRNYQLKSNDISINFNENTTNTQNVIKKVAYLLNVYSDNEVELKQLVINKLASYKFKATKNFEKLIIEYNDGGLFNFAVLNNQDIYIVNNVSYSLTNQKIDVETGIETIEISILIDNTTTVSFTATKI